MNGGILYLGDTSLDTAAAYLAGLMTAWDWDFTYVPGDRPLKEDDLEGGPRLFILSDYPAARISTDLQRRIVDDVKSGAGLLMIGGWESYHGQGGDWDGTPIGKVLPVEIADSDDRLNCDQPIVAHRVLDHPSVAGLPWDDHPPVIGGQPFSSDHTYDLELDFNRTSLGLTLLAPGGTTATRASTSRTPCSARDSTTSPRCSPIA